MSKICSLHLFDTNLSEMSGTAPSSIDLTQYMVLDSPKTVVIIGRGSPAFPADVVLNAKRDGESGDVNIISRHHAKLTYSIDYGWEIEDLKSLNGTFVNRKRISRIQLNHGDVLQIGGISNVPVGETIAVSGLSIKYRFNCQSPKNKNKRNTTTSEENNVVKKTPKKSSKSSPDASVKSSINTKSSSNSELDEAHAALNRIHASKDARILSLEENLQNAEKALLHMSTQSNQHQGKIQSLELKHAQNKELMTVLEKRNKELQQSCDGMKDEQRMMRERLAETQSINKSLERRVLALAAPTSQRMESTHYISTSALRMHLECSLCDKVLINPVITSCSHGFCLECLKTASANWSKKTFDCPVCKENVSNDYVYSDHLKSVVAIHENHFKSIIALNKQNLNS